jgi:hypothetical protein
VCFIVAFHRIGAVPDPQAHSSPPQPTSPDSPSVSGPTSIAESPDPVPEGPPRADDGPDTPAMPASGKVASPSTPTHRMMTPEHASRRTTARVASRSSGGSHAAASSRVPKSTLTRRMTSAPASRGAMPGSAQSYFDLANQQMHKGNYAAAAANYRRAWRIQQNSAAAKSRLVRARRVSSVSKSQKPH